MILAAGLEDLDVCFVAGEPRVSLVGSFYDVQSLDELGPDYDAALEEELAWFCLSQYDRRVFLGLCLRADIRPLSRTAADMFDKVDEGARATLAHRYLDGAAKHEVRLRERITKEVDRLRAELEQSREIWARVEGIVDVLVGDRA